MIHLFLAVKDVVKFSEVAGVTNFRPGFLREKCKENLPPKIHRGPVFHTGGGGCKNPKIHHLDLLGPPLLKKLSIVGERKHTPPCSSAELFFAKKMGVTEERFWW